MRELTYKAAVSLVNGLATVYGDLPDSIPFVKKKVPLWVILLSATGNLVTISEDVAKELALTTPYSLDCIRRTFGLR
uniref:Uncharacterized protein n=1 Tax=viral metagenome TaxID=1070528 RepID=A0A6M3IKL1_9ZZZZ